MTRVYKTPENELCEGCFADRPYRYRWGQILLCWVCWRFRRPIAHIPGVWAMWIFDNVFDRKGRP